MWQYTQGKWVPPQSQGTICECSNSVGIPIPFCCDWFKEVMWHSCGHWGTKEKIEVRWGTSRKDFPSLQKERYMGEALGSSILLAFWLCCLRLWCLELRQLFCYHEEHIMTCQTCQQKDEGSLEPKWLHWADGLKVLDRGQIRLHAGCLLGVICRIIKLHYLD